MRRNLDAPLIQGQGLKDDESPQSGMEATPNRWSCHITHIRRLYIDEQLPLKDVMKIMARDYEFHAGIKTYKAQLKKFGIKKNVHLGGEDEIQALQSTLRAKYTEESGFGLVDQRVKLASGQIVSSSRLARHLGRKKVTVDRRWKQLTDSADTRYCCATGPISRVIDGPDIFRLPELVFSEVATYVSAKFSIGPASMNPEIRGTSSPLAIQAHSAIDNATQSLADGKLEDAIAQLRAVPEHMKLLLGNGGIEPPMTLFLIWKIIAFLTASAALSGLDVDGMVRALVRYTATICIASTSLSPQLRQIIDALSQLSIIEGSVMFETAVRGILCMCAQQDIAIGIPGSIYSSVQQRTRSWFAAQKWMTSFEYTIWPAWEHLVQLKGESSPEAIAAMYSVLVIERQKPIQYGNSSHKLRSAVEQTLRVIPDNSALALAHRKGHVQWAVANMPSQSDSHGLVEAYMQDALDTAIRREETTLYELSALRAWLAGWVEEAEVKLT